MTYQKPFNKILSFGEEFLWEFILQLYYFLEYQVLISTAIKEKRKSVTSEHWCVWFRFFALEKNKLRKIEFCKHSSSYPALNGGKPATS